MFTNPSVSDFQNQFTRDFPYGMDPNTSVQSSDISTAFQFVNASINIGMWPDQGTYTLAYLYLAAHYLVLNLRASSQGLSGQWTWAQEGKSAGGVSTNFAIPERILDNPDFMAYTKTNYGAMYLNLLWPQLAGQIFVAFGRTKP